MKMNVVRIEPTWPCCNYKWIVGVKRDVWSIESTNYILETLRKWFGEAEYFWNDCYLCGKK